MHFIFFTCLQCNDYIVYYHGFQQTVMVFRRSSGKALGNFSLPAPASCFLTTDGESDGVGGRSKKKLIIGGKVLIICIKDDFTNGRAFFCLDYPKNTVYCDLYWKWDTYVEPGQSITLLFINRSTRDRGYFACPNIFEKMCLETKFQPFQLRNDQDIDCPSSS